MGDLDVADGLNVTVVRSEGRADLAMSGEIDLMNVERFRRALMGAVLEAPDSVNVDLSAVRFVGSEGISTLIQARRLAARKGVQFRIVNVSRRVGSVLELLGLAGYFE